MCVFVCVCVRVFVCVCVRVFVCVCVRVFVCVCPIYIIQYNVLMAKKDCVTGLT